MNVIKSLLIDSIRAVECMQKDFEENGIYSPELYDRLVGPMLAMDNEILANLDTSPVAAALDTIYGDLYAYLYKEYPSGTMDLGVVSEKFQQMLAMVA
jgi:hypothetical protein